MGQTFGKTDGVGGLMNGEREWAEGGGSVSKGRSRLQT